MSGKGTEYTYLFGPVHSRRFGISLGIDLTPFKTCTLNCVYCECGATTHKTADIKEYVPTEAVIAELDDFFSKNPSLDTATFSGSGEPTLHSGIGRIIDHIKNNYPQYRVTVLTNGTLLSKKEVRDRLLRADTVVPSLDGISPDVFQKMVEPAAGITPDVLLSGIELFRKEYTGRLLLEIFLIPGVNDSDDEIKKFQDAARRIGAEGVQLNSLDRPGLFDWIVPMTRERMEHLALGFAPVPVEIVSRVSGSGADEKRNGKA